MPFFKENYNGIFIRFRRERMRKFYSLLAPLDSTHVLDVGGMPSTWNEESGPGHTFRVTLINLHKLDVKDPRITTVVANAMELPFADSSFDIAFSNSVIEHLGTWENQVKYAKEVSRVSKKLWIQTPARCFPIEPHYLAPFIHYFPKQVQRLLIRNFTTWGWNFRPDKKRVESILDELRLLTFAEFKRLFPDCNILRERFFGITKSYVAYRV